MGLLLPLAVLLAILSVIEGSGERLRASRLASAHLKLWMFKYMLLVAPWFGGGRCHFGSPARPAQLQVGCSFLRPALPAQSGFTRTN